MNKGLSELFLNTYGAKLKKQYASNVYGLGTDTDSIEQDNATVVPSEIKKDVKITNDTIKQATSMFSELEQSHEVRVIAKDVENILKDYLDGEQAIAVANLLFKAKDVMEAVFQGPEKAINLIVPDNYTMIGLALNSLTGVKKEFFKRRYKEMYFLNETRCAGKAGGCYDALKNVKDLYKVITGEDMY